jgi:hypothetical protein
MRIIAFPGRRASVHEDPRHEELEAALRGEGRTAESDAWVALRADVRALAPPMSAGFERTMQTRIETWAARAPAAAAPRPVRAATGSSRGARGPWRGLGSRGLRGAAAAAASCALVVAAIIAAGITGGGRSGPAVPPSRAAAAPSVAAGAASSPGAKTALAPTQAPIPAPGPAAGQAPGRVQQLAASITLASAPSQVQALADRVSRLAVSDGGFVQSSQVQQQSEGANAAGGEATLQLSIPSAKLAAALASLAQLAPVRAESQSLQDITSSYDAAQRKLNDALALRTALLRALSRASTQGQIDSLREQLSLAGGAITRARAGLAAVSGRAANALTEVTVRGDVQPSSEGLTLDRGLHDAGHVLTVALAVLLIALAVLVPLALAVGVLVVGARAWRRMRRERVLERH